MPCQLITVFGLSKISAFIFKVSQHGFRSQKTLHFSNTAVKTSNLTGKKHIHTHTHTCTRTHCTKHYSPATHDVASRGEPFVGSDRHSGVRSFSLLRTCPVTKAIFPTCYSFNLLLLFSFGSLLPINTSLTKPQLSNVQQ
jgi:hypothetical protein